MIRSLDGCRRRGGDERVQPSAMDVGVCTCDPVSMWEATLIVGLMMAAAAAALISGASGRVKRIHPIPERTVESVKENLEWMKRPTK